MKPSNLPPANCSPTGSSCVVWDGPKIDCIKLCTGDTITSGIYNLAKELCTILEQLDIDNYNIDCLQFDKCKPKDFKALIQHLIDKVCTLSGVDNSSGGSSDGCPNCTVSLAPCFQYNNPGNGDLVTTALLHEYVQLIGLRICTIVSTISTQQEVLADLATRVQTLETEQPAQYTLPSLFPKCVGTPNTSMTLDELAAATEAALCDLLGATGSVSAIYQSIVIPEVQDLNNRPALSNPSATMSSLEGWISTVNNLAQSYNNSWLAILDLRNAVRNIQLNCCNTACEDIDIVFTATMATANTIKLYFTGNIPNNFTNCVITGSMFKIEDSTGTYVNQSVNVVSEMNNASGFTINLSGSPLNLADDLYVSSTLCFTDTETGTVCQRVVSYSIVNTLGCPEVVYVAGEDTITYSFDHATGALTYSVQLFNSSNIMVAVQNFVVTGPTTINNQFSGLDPNTIYKARIQMITATQTKTCPFTSVTTGNDPCPVVQEVTVTFSIP